MRVVLARLNLPWACGEARFQSRTVLSRELETKVSLDGHRDREVTGAVWPLKYRRYWLSWVDRYRIVSSDFVDAYTTDWE